MTDLIALLETIRLHLEKTDKTLNQLQEEVKVLKERIKEGTAKDGE